MLKPLTAALTLFASAASADLSVSFVEGAPKDRFVLTNTGTCPLPAAEVVLDLGVAPTGLIFDVTGAGAGVQVFQPFELVAGAEHLTTTPQVLDGDAAIALSLRGLGPDQSVAFTIDVDDTSGGREITVDGSEIAGAMVRVRLSQSTLSAPFDTNARALVPLAACVS